MRVGLTTVKNWIVFRSDRSSGSFLGLNCVDGRLACGGGSGVKDVKLQKTMVMVVETLTPDSNVAVERILNVVTRVVVFRHMPGIPMYRVHSVFANVETIVLGHETVVGSVFRVVHRRVGILLLGLATGLIETGYVSVVVPTQNTIFTGKNGGVTVRRILFIERHS